VDPKSTSGSPLFYLSLSLAQRQFYYTTLRAQSRSAGRSQTSPRPASLPQAYRVFTDSADFQSNRKRMTSRPTVKTNLTAWLLTSSRIECSLLSQEGVCLAKDRPIQGFLVPAKTYALPARDTQMPWLCGKYILT